VNVYPSMSIGKVPESDHRALLEYVSRLKHDLGKYVRFQSRWLPEDADLQTRREALAADLLHTRRGPDGSVDAIAVWAEFAPGLSGGSEVGGCRFDLRDDPDVEAIFKGMQALGPVIEGLRGAQVDAVLVAEGERAAKSVAEAIRALVDRVRAAGPASG